MGRAQRPSLDDVTGNRTENPNIGAGKSSDPTRNLSLAQLFGNDDGNPFGVARDMDFYPEDDFAAEREGPVAFLNSRLDLESDLPSTKGQRFIPKP